MVVCGPRPTWEWRGASGVVHAAGFSVGDAAGLRGKEESSGPRGWLGREKRLGLKKEGVDRTRWGDRGRLKP